MRGSATAGTPRSRWLAIVAANPRGAVYGTIVATAAIAAAAGHQPPGRILAATVATLLVFWLAHVYADVLDHRLRQSSFDLKVRAGAGPMPGAAVPSHLQRHGVPPLTRELAGYWRARQGVIDGLVERADALGRHLARSSFPQVLCHADLHTWNVLVDADQQPWIVDWDEAILAPRSVT